MTDNSSSSTTCCAACLLPPRPSPEKDGEYIPLLRCSRCQEVWYHDVTCQRKHYKTHKQTCLAHSKNSSTKKEASTASAPTEDESSAEKQFVIEERPGKGRCMIAARTIPSAQPILPSGNKNNNSNSNNIYFEAMVPPVLTTDMRGERCAFCFRGTYNLRYYLFEQNPHHHINYTVMLCSPECVKAGTPWLADEERLIVKILQDDDEKNLAPPAKLNTILPYSVYVYRVILAMVNNNPHIQTTLDTMQANPEWSSLSSLAGRDFAYAKPSVLQVGRMLQERLADTTSNNRQYQPPLNVTNATAAANLKRLMSSSENTILQILSKLAINGYSVCDREINTIGIGLFPIANYVNHSCRPNTLHTFSYGAYGHRPPRLRLTTCRAIASGEEIRITYIDNHCTKKDRLVMLKNYGFDCDCPICTDEVQEQAIVGLKCMKCGGVCRLNPTTQVRQCASCHAKLNGKEVLKTMKEFDSSDYSGNLSLAQLQRFYRQFRKYCTSSSWYHRQSAQMYACHLIHILEDDDGERSNEQKTKMGQEALTILEKLLVGETEQDDDANGWKFLAINLLRFRAVKLQLRLGGDTATGMQELNQIRNAWLLYYPPDHEVFTYF